MQPRRIGRAALLQAAARAFSKSVCIVVRARVRLGVWFLSVCGSWCVCVCLLARARVCDRGYGPGRGLPLARSPLFHTLVCAHKYTLTESQREGGRTHAGTASGLAERLPVPAGLGGIPAYSCRIGRNQAECLPILRAWTCARTHMNAGAACVLAGAACVLAGHPAGFAVPAPIMAESGGASACAASRRCAGCLPLRENGRCYCA